ncbi:MAG: DinB family protein [Chloroflexi bacterium]|nr:DinB family protein [Chloroflexota bacterium]
MTDSKKEAILSKLNSERTDLEAFLDGLTAVAWQTAVYSEDITWTFVDILRHLVDAEQGMIGLMRQWQQGKNPVPTDFDLARWNARVIHKAAEKSADELREEMVANRANLLTLIAAFQPEDWAKKGRHGSLRIMTIEEVCHLIADHELSHLAVMKTAVSP